MINDFFREIAYDSMSPTTLHVLSKSLGHEITMSTIYDTIRDNRFEPEAYREPGNKAWRIPTAAAKAYLKKRILREGRFGSNDPENTIRIQRKEPKPRRKPPTPSLYSM
jgi:hypothetical protein